MAAPRKPLVVLVVLVVLATAACDPFPSFDGFVRDGARDADTDVLVEAGREAGVSAPAGAVVWPENGHAYLVVAHDAPISWLSANAEAQAMGGHLATITSGAENVYVFSLVNRRDDAWDGNSSGPYLGGFQLPGSAEPSGGWSWVTGEPWAFQPWALNEPSNSGDEKYLNYNARSMPVWNDTWGTARAFVVEFE